MFLDPIWITRIFFFLL